MPRRKKLKIPNMTKMMDESQKKWGKKIGIPQ